MYSHVCLVEDSDIAVLIAEELFTSVNVAKKVTVFQDAESIWAFFKEMLPSDWPDILFIDINLPGISGLELLKNLQTNNVLGDAYKPSIYVLSTSEFERDKKEVEKIDAVKGFIVKPLREEHLHKLLS